MTKLSALFPPADLARAVLDGYVRIQQHPTLPWSIANYTEKASWESIWTPVTLQCRGLVFDDKGNVIARPFPKFFNWDQEEAPKFGLDDEIECYEKMDGSLGILLPNGEVCTRGSFTSDQAKWATAWYQETQFGYKPNDKFTSLFEIIYPENRIVVDYGQMEGLISLGYVEIATGDYHPPLTFDGYRMARRFAHGTLKEALESEPRSNAEGFVIWKPSTNERVKIKYDEYKRLHKFLTGVNERHIWEVLAAGGDTVEAFAGDPDEFHDWIRAVSDGLCAEFDALHDKVTVEYLTVLDELPEGFERKAFAEAVLARQDKGFLFAQLDQKPIDGLVWRAVKPSGSRTFRRVDNDND